MIASHWCLMSFLVVLTLPAAADEPRDQQVRGKALFESVGCWSCHGFAGQGAMSRGIASGPRINARIYPKEAFFHQLRTPANLMPPYTAQVLTDAQVEDIYAYLKSLPAPDGASSIPALKALP